MQEFSFPRELFADGAAAGRSLDALHEAFIESGSPFPVGDFTKTLLTCLPAAPDPDLALTNLLRFSESTLSKSSLFSDLVQYPGMAEVLAKVFGSSRYFADILVREPGLFRWLTTSDALTRPATGEELTGETARILRTFRGAAKRLDALKRLYRREILRTGTQDILGRADLASVTGQLSQLADALVDAVLCVTRDEVMERFGLPPPTTLGVIGLGKLGGCELNYSSDIDVLFVYGEEGTLQSKKSPAGETYHEYMNRFAEMIVQNLSRNTSGGHLYRVDTRLRPEFRVGPLARSLQGYITYYESRGELWERQMLIKARPVAGDKALGDDFTRLLQPFVYPRTLLQHPAEYVSRIKARIEAAVGDESNIKLMRGGIRDIEFIVQTLQLINGGRVGEVRERNTLKAVRRLAGKGFLSGVESGALTRAYTFFRTLEHRLQTALNTQTHTLPSGDGARRLLAKRLGLDSAAQLDGKLRRHLRAVRAVFDQVLLAEAPAEEIGITALLDGGMREEAVKNFAARFGFHDPRSLAKNVRFLVSGTTLTDARDFDARGVEAFRAAAPLLFADLSRSPVPDMTLNNLIALIAAQKSPPTLYTQLRSAGFRKFLLDVCSISPRLARGLAQRPLLLERLASDPAFLAGTRSGSAEITGTPVGFKAERELEAGIRHVLGFTSFEELTRELTAAADAVVASVFASESRRRRQPAPPLAVFALGKYGTRELTIDADLDLLFVAEAPGAEVRARLEKLASSVVSALSAATPDGRLYEVDARLRPEGKNAPLLVDGAAYARYLRERSSLWERQSLTRLRFVCGDERVGRQVSGDVASFVYDTPLPAGWVDAVIGMRRKVETRSRFQGEDFLDIKLGPGGMVDVEFLTQMMVLASGRAPGGAHPRGVKEILAERAGRWCSGEEVTKLTEAYGFFRRLELLIRLTLEEHSTVLPGGKTLEVLSACVDRSSASALHARVSSTMREVRQLFLQVSQRLQHS